MAEIVGCSKKFAKIVAKENESKKIIKRSPTFFTEKLSGKNKYERGENFNPKSHLIKNLTLIIRRYKAVISELPLPTESTISSDSLKLCASIAQILLLLLRLFLVEPPDIL